MTIPFYNAGARTLQDRFDSRRLADRWTRVVRVALLMVRTRRGAWCWTLCRRMHLQHKSYVPDAHEFIGGDLVTANCNGVRWPDVHSCGGRSF